MYVGRSIFVGSVRSVCSWIRLRADACLDDFRSESETVKNKNKNIVEHSVKNSNELYFSYIFINIFFGQCAFAIDVDFKHKLLNVKHASKCRWKKWWFGKNAKILNKSVKNWSELFSHSDSMRFFFFQILHLFLMWRARNEYLKKIIKTPKRFLKILKKKFTSFSTILFRRDCIYSKRNEMRGKNI